MIIQNYSQFKGILIAFYFLSISMASQALNAQSPDEPLKIGIAGLTHSHVHGILGRPAKGDINIVGIAEQNRELAERYSEQYGFSMDIVFNTLQEMIAVTQPEAVSVFGQTNEHLMVAEVCAPKGIHIMVEKPLAVSFEHAKKMKMLAERYNIHLLTNYETTWYATNHKAYDMVMNDSIGFLRKIVVHDGHKGPVEIGINAEFLEWLTDPVKNGGGALTDFGCYGANLITWLNQGERPEAVVAMTQNIKPELYSNVDDEATILLKYPKMQGIIQASWNWPIARKDMEIYGTTGYIFSDNRSNMRFRISEEKEEKHLNLRERSAPYDDPFAFFKAVVRNEITLPPFDLSSLENNMIVMEILEAAKKSAESGRIVRLKNLEEKTD